MSRRNNSRLFLVMVVLVR